MDTKNLILRGDVWHFEKIWKGRRIVRTTHQTSIVKARAVRDDFMRLLREGEADALRQFGVRSGYPSFGELFDLYREYGRKDYLEHGRPLLKTVEANVSCMRRVLSVSFADPDSKKINALTPAVASAYVAALVTAAGQDEILKDRARRSASSMLINAASVFSKRACQFYESKGIDVPESIQRFKAGLKQKRPEKYQIPPRDLRAATIEWGKSLKGKDENLYAAFCLMFDCGLRNSEAVAARVEWLEEGEGGWELVIAPRSYWKGAKNYRRRRIPVADGVAADLLALPWADAPNAPLLGVASPTGRERLVGRKMCDELRKIGWTNPPYQKAAYELRKLAVSRWYTAFGAEYAAKYGGDSIETIFRYYADVDRDRPAVNMREV
jgi:integrase